MNKEVVDDIKAANVLLSKIPERKIPKDMVEIKGENKLKFYYGDSDSCKEVVEVFKRIKRRKLTEIQTYIVNNRIHELSLCMVNRWIAKQYKETILP